MQKAGLRRPFTFNCDCLSFFLSSDLLFAGGLDDGLDAGVEAALVAAGGVLVQDTLLDALVEHGDGGRVGGGDGLLIADGKRLAQDAEGAAELALVGAVGRSLGDGLTCALQ